jgi:hypothetical protein
MELGQGDSIRERCSHPKFTEKDYVAGGQILAKCRHIRIQSTCSGYEEKR